MFIKSKSLIAFLSLAVSSAVFAEDATEITTATTPTVTATKSAYMNEDEKASVSVWTEYFGNSPSKGDKFVFTPHIRNPIFGGFATLDVYAQLSHKDNTAQIDVNPVIALEKTVIKNDYLLVMPWAEFYNVGKSKDTSVMPLLDLVVSYPVSTSTGKVTPYIFNEAGISLALNDTTLDANYPLKPSNLNLTMTPEQVKKEGLEDKVVGNQTKYPYFNYTRFAVAYEPNLVKGLKVTGAVNFNVTATDKYIFDKDKNYLDTQRDTVVTSQPMFRVEYAINDHFFVRNDTTYDFDNAFERATEKQDTAGNVTNYTRFIYTLF